MIAKNELILRTSKVTPLMSLPLALMGTFILMWTGYRFLHLNHKSLLQWHNPEFYGYLSQASLCIGAFLVVGGFTTFFWAPWYSLGKALLLLRRQIKLSSEGITMQTAESGDILRPWSDISSVQEQHSGFPGIDPTTHVQFLDGTELVVPGNMKGYTDIVNFIKHAPKEKPEDIQSNFENLLLGKRGSLQKRSEN